jgi:thiamine biosynthesis lipoprotein
MYSKKKYVVWFWLYCLAGCFHASQAQENIQRYEFRHGQMGTHFRLVFYAPPNSLQMAEAIAKQAFCRLDTLNARLSDYLNGSELNQLSASAGKGHAVAVSDDLWSVLYTAQRVSRWSRGAFDVSVGPLVQLWRRAGRQQELPDARQLAAARQKTGYRYIKMYRKTRSVQLKKEGMRLDLGGIAKGYANGEMAIVLQQHGIRSFLIEGGGDLLMGAAPPGQSGWKLSVQKPDSTLVTEILYLSHTAFATSGDMFRFVELNGIRYSHVVSPFSGLGITAQRQVSVQHPDPMLADALASALQVSGWTAFKTLKKKTKIERATLLEQHNGQLREYFFPVKD